MRWTGYKRKRQVEECRLILDMSKLVKAGIAQKNSSHIVKIESKWDSIVVIPFIADNSLDNGKAFVELMWLDDNEHMQEIRIGKLQYSPINLIWRWIFICPTCGKNCYRLYLPMSGKFFACKKCYNLTDKQGQEHDRLLDKFRRMSTSELFTVYFNCTKFGKRATALWHKARKVIYERAEGARIKPPPVPRIEATRSGMKKSASAHTPSLDINSPFWDIVIDAHPELAGALQSLSSIDSLS